MSFHHTLDLLGLKESPYSLPSLQLDLSSIRPTLLSHDLQLDNKHSNQSWKVHKDILAIRLPNTPENMAKLRALISTTKIPPSSIYAFVDFLYFKPLAVGADWIKFVSELCHIVFLCEALDIECPEAISLLETQIEAHLAPIEAADMLFEFWFDPDIEWKTSSTVINLLAKKSSTIETPQLLEQLKSCEKPPNDIVRAMELAFKLTSMSSWKLEEVTFDDPLKALSIPSSRILINPKRALSCETDFAFASNNHWTIAKGWVLYPRWSWFKRLIDSGLEESKARIITMPAWVTVNIMHTIIKTVYHQYTTSIQLSNEEMTLILEKGFELDLLDASGEVVSPFGPLIERCRMMLLRPPTEETCLELLRLNHRLRLEDRVSATLKVIVRNYDDLLLEELEPELQKLIDDALAAANEAA